MILLDTTVLVYAVGEEHPLRDPCRRLLAAHADGRIEAVTTVEVIQEFTRVRARRLGRADAVRLARQYRAAFELLAATPDDLERALALFERHPAVGAFDAVLAAVALERRVDALVSADRAFAGIPGLPFVDLAGPALDRLGAG
jgi:hypothetical protein